MHSTPPADTPILNADDPTALDAAAAILGDGGCVALPTETVYGLAADATNGQAVARVYEAKGRPRFNPLIAHVDTLERAHSLIDLPPAAVRLVEAFWPGPLTIVARRRPDAPVSALAAAGLDTLAVRLPASNALHALVRRLDRPLAAPSANPSGAVSPTRADHVKAGLNGRIDLILDGGPCPVGVESTIISFIDPEHATLLRPGGLARADIETITGPLIAHTPDAEHPSAPGQLASHYAPKAAVRMNATSVNPEESYLAFGRHADVASAHYFNLSPAGDLAEAASNLFVGLRTLDEASASIAVAPIPDEGLGEAINDRLRRACVR